MALSDREVQHLVSEIKDYQLTHGSLLKLVSFEEPSTVPARPVGVSLFPTLFWRSRFDEAINLQALFNELYIRAACDEEWLYDVLEPLRKHDVLIAALWEIYAAVKGAGVVQNISCGIFRSDYMLHVTPQGASIKQVEMNTFSVAGACHAERIAKMHRFLQRVEAMDPATVRRYTLPKNNNTSSIISVLAEAYRTHRPTMPSRACILMIVQPDNFNIADERPIEYGLWDEDIPCYRCEWQDIFHRTNLTPDRTLLFRRFASADELEVSVIYYRAGYDAGEYDDVGKYMRLRLELSRAIKCPDVLTHLTTFKAVQQALTKPDAVEGFLSAEKAIHLRKTFMPMQVLDHSNGGQAARQLALDPQLCQHYVLKPNLEGGGHNVYRQDIPVFLRSVPEAQWHKYILMRLIEPPEARAALMMPSDLYQGRVVSELGIIGTCIWRREGSAPEVLSNEMGGWTFKTKPAEVDEMSVVKGYGCFDCPGLVDDAV